MMFVHTRRWPRNMDGEHCTKDKCVWTGKSAKHMREIRARVHAHRGWAAAHDHRMRLIERHRSQTFKGLTDSRAEDTPLASIGVVHDEDRGASKASCPESPWISEACRLSMSPTGRTCRSDQNPPISPQESRSPAKSPMAPPQAPLSRRSIVVAAAMTKPVKKPTAKKRAGAKATKKLERLVSKGFELEPAEATMFRALSACANYLSQDRPDISYPGKELCREFAFPNKNSFLKLKRLVRYSCGLPRLVYEYPWLDAPPDSLEIFVDTDSAGCVSARRSTSGGAIMLGNHCIRHWSTTQTTISLSSGEAELHGIAKGISHENGMQSICRDLGWHYKL